MKKSNIIILGSIIYSLIFTFLSSDIQISTFIANFMLPLIPSLIISLIIEFFKSITKKEYRFNDYNNVLYKTWLIIISLSTLGTLLFYFNF